MGKILFSQETEKGTTNYIAGTIMEMRNGSGRGEGKVRNATMDLIVSENKKNVHKRIEIAMWDDERNPENKRRQVATRSRNAKLDSGSFTLVVCGNIAEKDSSAQVPVLSTTAFDFSYNMRRSVEVDTEKGVYTNEIICGVIRRIKLEGDHPYIVIPVNTFNDGKQGTDWITIFLKKDDENAKKYMQIGVPIACMTSEAHESDSGEYHNLSSNMFTYVMGKAN